MEKQPYGAWGSLKVRRGSWQPDVIWRKYRASRAEYRSTQLGTG